MTATTLGKFFCASIALAMLGSCFGSDKPLFPDGTIKASTVIKPGLYMHQRMTSQNGKLVIGLAMTPTAVNLQGTKYELLKQSGFEFSATSTTSQRSELFKSTMDANRQDAPLIAQSPYRTGLAGKGPLIYLYNRVDVGDGYFYVTEQKCPGSRARIVGRGQGWIAREEGGVCFYSDSSKLTASLHLADLWKDAPRDAYFAVRPSRVVTWSGLGAKLSPWCEAGEQPVTLGPALGGDAGPAVPHWRVLAVASAPNATIGNGIAVEAVGDTMNGWAKIDMWDPVEGKLSCGPAIYMKVQAFRPTENRVTLRGDPATIAERCSRAGLFAPNCGALPFMIERWSAGGLKILAQGQRYHGFPGRKLVVGDTLTVLASEGRSPRIVALATDPSGTTHVAWKYPSI